MKLKKIASLMLAGIMAVSMLAACGEGKGNSNSGSSSSTPASTGIVAAVEGAIKNENSDLKIAVKSSNTMTTVLNKYFKDTAAASVSESNIKAKLNDVFGTGNVTYSWGADASSMINHNGRAAGRKLYVYTIVNDDAYHSYNTSFETYAANVIGASMKDVENRFAANADTLDGTYTMYVYAGEAEAADGSTDPYVVAVIEASYKTVL